MLKKYLGIDYGKKRIGIALSDDGGKLAFAKAVLPNDKDFFKKLFDIIKKENVSAVVIGESLDENMQDNPLMKDIKKLKREIERETGLPTHLEPEFMTSIEASRFTGENDMNDASAAALILQRYLDRL